MGACLPCGMDTFNPNPHGQLVAQGRAFRKYPQMPSWWFIFVQLVAADLGRGERSASWWPMGLQNQDIDLTELGR